MHIVLLGYMGSGKSTVGKKLAEKLHVDFIDLDEYIEEKEGSSINQLFATKGEIYFRKLENIALKELMNSEDSFVLAVGGGTPCYSNNIELINESDFSIYLKSSIKELYNRLLKQKDDRPLIKDLPGESLLEFIGKHLFERLPYYEKAKLVISSDGKEVEEIVDEITLKMQ